MKVGSSAATGVQELRASAQESVVVTTGSTA